MEMYTAKEAARILGVTYQTLLKYIHDGKLKTCTGGDRDKGKRGVAYMISSQDIDNFKAAKYPTKKFAPRKEIPLIDENGIMKRIAFHISGWNFKKLSDKMELHYTTVMSVINGKSRVTREFSKKFADIFGLDQNELELCIKKGEMPFMGAEAEGVETKKQIEEAPKQKPVPTLIKKVEVPSTDTKDSAPKSVQKESTAVKYYAVTCYTRTKDGVIFDNVGFQAGHTNLATKKLFTDRLMAKAYILSLPNVKFDNNSKLYYTIYVNEKTLVAYKTCYDIVEMEVNNG